jgi:NADH-quinone oxidoreductase subunit B
MPRPESVIKGFEELQSIIAKGEGNGAKKYKENLEWYRANQKKVLKNWPLEEYNW